METLNKNKEFELIEFSNEQAYSNLDSKIITIKPKYISVDIFDTILIRKTKSELSRFKHFSKIVGNTYNINSELVFNARLFSHQSSYSINLNAEKEAKFEDIITVTAKILGLDDKISEIIQIELEIEKKDLLVNSKLINVLKNHKYDIYLVSDMYLSKKHIVELFVSLDMDLKFKNLYVSSDYQLSKRNGSFYKFLKKELKGTGLHVGDNKYSDIFQAKQNNFETFYLRQHSGH